MKVYHNGSLVPQKPCFVPIFVYVKKKNACRMLFVFHEPTPTVFCINIVTKFQEIRRISGLKGGGEGREGGQGSVRIKVILNSWVFLVHFRLLM